MINITLPNAQVTRIVNSRFGNIATFKPIGITCKLRIRLMSLAVHIYILLGTRRPIGLPAGD